MQFNEVYTQIYAWLLYHTIRKNPAAITELVQFIPGTEFVLPDGLILGDVTIAFHDLHSYKDYELDELEGLFLDWHESGIPIFSKLSEEVLDINYHKSLIYDIQNRLDEELDEPIKRLLRLLIFFYKYAIDVLF